MANALGTSAISLSFAEELMVANLHELPFSWDSSGNFNFMPEVTPNQRAAIRAVYAKHNPLTSILSQVALNFQEQKASARILINVNLTGDPLMVIACTDSRCMINLMSATRVAESSPDRTFNWVGFDGSTTILTVAQINTLFDKVSHLHQTIFDVYGEVLNGIKNGSITTKAQIEETFNGIQDYVLAPP